MKWGKRVFGLLLMIASAYVVFLQLAMLASESHAFRGSAVVLLPLMLLFELVLIYAGFRLVRT